jgi:hypothetical protein
MKGTKTFTEVNVEYTISEILIEPEFNRVTITADPNIGIVRRIVKTSDVTDRVNTLPADKLEEINDLFRRLVAIGLGVNHTEIEGDIFTKSS